MLMRQEFNVPVGDQDDLALSLAAANSHVAYTWWKTYDDALYVTTGVVPNLPIPLAWVEDAGVRKSVVALGHRLIEEIRESNITLLPLGTQGSQHLSLSFHVGAPEATDEIDRLYLTTLGLPAEPLLKQLRKLRSNSTWQL